MHMYRGQDIDETLLGNMLKMLMGAAWDDFNIRLKKSSQQSDTEANIVSQSQLKLLVALQQHLFSVWGQCHSRPPEASFTYACVSVALTINTGLSLSLMFTGYAEAAATS